MIVRDENTGAGRLSVGLALAFLTCAALPEAGAAGTPTVVVQPLQAAPGATVTLSGTGFGRFISTANNRVTFNGVPALVQRWERGVIEVKVPFQAATGLVVSWTDTEIVVRVPRRNLYSIGKRGEFYDNLATGPLVLRRGSWDVQPDGLPDTTYWNNRPDAYQPIVRDSAGRRIRGGSPSRASPHHLCTAAPGFRIARRCSATAPVISPAI